MQKTILIFFSILFIFFSNGCKSKKTQIKEEYDLIEKKDKKAKHKPTLAEIFAETITIDDLDYHVYNLSADTMRGRYTGKRGDKMAANYIKDFFIDQQILFPLELEGYMQKYTATENNLPKVSLETDVSKYKFGEDFISFFPHDDISISSDYIIFAGYGIEDPRFNDYAYRDVKNKIVLIRGGEPRDRYGNYIISGGNRPSQWSEDPIHSYILKRNAAMKHGAKVLLIYDPANAEYFWKNFEKKFKSRKLSVSVKKDSVYDFFISKKIFTDLTGYDNPEEMDYTRKTRKLTVPVKMKYINNSEIVESQNVLGIIEGAKYKDEYIAIITHYDGQGVRNGEIYPSANDNASGVAASFEIAEAFRAAIDSGFVPKRNILFINFSGHEQNELGAKFYIEHPVVPLDKTIAVIELHMLGRLPQDDEITDFYKLHISFDGFQPDGFKKGVNDVLAYNKHINVFYNDDYDNSDYTVFKKKKVPVIYFHGKTFPDYHKPSDTPDKISYEILQKRTQFIFQIIWKIVNQNKI